MNSSNDSLSPYTAQVSRRLLSLHPQRGSQPAHRVLVILQVYRTPWLTTMLRPSIAEPKRPAVLPSASSLDSKYTCMCVCVCVCVCVCARVRVRMLLSVLC